MHDQSISAEVRLFRCIILNAVLDAIYGSCLTNENSDQIRAEAWNWFARAGADFRTVCEGAGFHPETVKRDALRYISRTRETLPPKTRRPSLHASQKPMRRKAA
jgi:hypothetical protein